MKERPIPFSGAMVRALLAGTKTQTRRVMPHQPPEILPGYLAKVYWPARDRHMTSDPESAAYLQFERPGDYDGMHVMRDGFGFRCPYGQPGDRLWVRETWQVARETLDYETGGEYDVWEWPDELGDPRHHLKGDARFGTKAGLFYAADGEDKNPGVFYDLTGFDKKTILRPKEINWRPSIHMPRWASRITLEVTGVRVERLQDISEADAQAEGARECDPVSGREVLLAGPSQRGSFVLHYRDIWEQINGAGSWEANPWVWVVEFKRLEARHG